ncbi:MAG: substrate-binding domain-containing protein, partial [Planctomycetota bacterium]
MLHGVVRCSLLIAFLAQGGTAFSGSVEVDAALPTYEASPGVVGSISSAGSDTMANVAAFWGQGFQKYYPGVTIDSEAKGSSTAVPALSGSKANFGMMSRAPKPAEEADFAKTRGYKPVVLAAGIDMLAVYTHKDNPLKSLTLPEVDAIFSQVRNLGHPEDITSWGQLGVTGALAGRKISLYGRNAASGTYGFFKGAALAKGDYKTAVKEQPGSAAVVQGVGSDLAGIGYSGIGYKTA